MKTNVNENTKITLTVGQLKRLVKESLRDFPPLNRSDFEEPVSDEDKAAGEAAKVRSQELRQELKKFLADNGIEPFEKNGEYINVRRWSGWGDEDGYWAVDVFDTMIRFYDNGRVKWDGGRTISGFDLDDEGDEDKDSLSAKKRFRFIQKMMNDKEFVKNLKEIVLRVGDEERHLSSDMWRRQKSREQIGKEKYDAANSARSENIKNEIRRAKFALLNIHGDDHSGVLYRNKPCEIIEVGDNEDELYDIMWHPWKHKEYQRAVNNAGRDARVVPVRLLRGL